MRACAHRALRDGPRRTRHGMKFDYVSDPTRPRTRPAVTTVGVTDCTPRPLLYFGIYLFPAGQRSADCRAFHAEQTQAARSMTRYENLSRAPKQSTRNRTGERYEFSTAKFKRADRRSGPSDGFLVPEDQVPAYEDGHQKKLRHTAAAGTEAAPSPRKSDTTCSDPDH